MKQVKLLTFLSAMLLSFASHAATSWHYAKVELAGTAPGGHYVKLTEVEGDKSFTQRLFKLDAQIADQALAVFLAAVSTGKQVYINTNISAVAESDTPIIKTVYATPKTAP